MVCSNFQIMSRGSLKKSIPLEKKPKLIPLPISKRNDDSERRGVHNSFFTDEEFNQMRYFPVFLNFLINSQSKSTSPTFR